MGIELRGKNGAIDLSRKMWKGDDGGYYIPSLDSEGNLTWAPSETEMPAVEGANIKGQKGDTGTSGVWVGDTEPTGDYNVWIDPTGSETAGLVTQAELATKQDKLTAGDNITIDSNNVISATGSGGSYTLPVASDNTLGGVKTGAAYIKSQQVNIGGVPIRITQDGVGYIPFASDTSHGILDISGTFRLLNNSGMVALNPPRKFDSGVLLGGVCPDGTTITMTDNGIISASAPTATTSTLGLVKPDGTSITIADGVISSTQPTKTSELTNDSGFITNEYHDPDKQNKLVAGDNITIADDGTISASHPAQYIKNANATENTLNLYFNDGTSVVFTPTGGSGGGSGGVSGYAFSSTQTLTDADKAHLKEIYINKNIYMTIDNLTVVRIMSMGSRWGFVVVNTNGATSNQVLVYTVNLDSSGNVTSNTFTLFMSYYLVGNSSALSGDIITSENWSQYISAGGGDWNSTTDNTYSDLYNAKELIIKLIGDTSAILFFYGYFPDGLGNNTGNYYLLPGSTSVSSGYLQYNGSSLDVWNSTTTIDTIYYKT